MGDEAAATVDLSHSQQRVTTTARRTGCTQVSGTFVQTWSSHDVAQYDEYPYDPMAQGSVMHQQGLSIQSLV